MKCGSADGKAAAIRENKESHKVTVVLGRESKVSKVEKNQLHSHVTDVNWQQTVRAVKC